MYRILCVAFVLLALSSSAKSMYIQLKGHVAQQLLSHAWQNTLDTGRTHKPWPWADTWPVARLSIPALGKSLIVLHGTSGEAMAFGPARLAAAGSNNETGVTVIGGHRDTHLSFLQHMQAGQDLLLETTDGATRTYRWSRHEIANADTDALSVSASQPGLVLITCYPFAATQTGGPLRFVMMAPRIL